ncbi:MAG: outer membrane beta-barrel domain-containing protein [Gammaproteobacteria bacterium]|nr:outer membrane beta-barrel domain-containing protein [Gammaproteobacteria bacterium]NNF66632.1 outer membrane beta-barrel domain-containing protein [Gammaproteobacteria bacterium]
MESRFYFFLLIALLFLCCGTAAAEESGLRQTSVIQPDLERRDIQVPDIDDEDFELGYFGGVMSIEDFGSNSVNGLRFSYHVTESFFGEVAYGRTTAGRTSYEVLSGAAELLTDAERELSYYSLSIGYNALPGELFVGRQRALGAALYFVAGAGSTDFAGESQFTLSLGAGARVLITDWLAIQLDVRDNLFDSDLLGTSKTTHNIGLHIGLSGFF